LFGCDNNNNDDDEDEDVGDSEEELKDGVTTAFGMKLLVEDEDGEEGGKGVAIANPAVDASVTEVAATVHACGGKVVFLVSPQDLARGEGLFDALGPALEDLLRQSDGFGGRSLIVVVEGTDITIAEAQQKLEAAASLLLTNLVVSNKAVPKTLSDVFGGNVQYMSSHSILDLERTLCSSSKEPSVAQSTVASAVYKSVNSGYTSTKTLHKSPYDLAAVRKLLPVSRSALQSCIATVQDKCSSSSSSSSSSDMGLVEDFGALCDAAFARSMEQFDAAANTNQLVKKSSVARRIRKELVQEMYAELDDLYQQQMNLLHQASFESFQRGLSKLRLSPNLKTDMQRVANEVIAQYQTAIQTRMSMKKNTNANANTSGESRLASARLVQLKRELAEYIHLRLQAAKADGKYKPLPRKGITIGMHWLLPKPFGNDYRQDPWKVHSMEDLVYTPKDKLTDVNPQDILNNNKNSNDNESAIADWTKHIVPAPTANEILYFK